MSQSARGTIRFEVAGFSEQGPRPENQDAFATDAFESVRLIALADGMGGEKSGRIAADTALEALKGVAPIGTIAEARRAVREADRAVSEAAERDPERLGGMGCAIGLLSLTEGSDGPGWIAAHVGDVRILSRSPDGVLRLETRDHTPAFARWEAGEITLDEIPDSAGANRLQRAVGRSGEADVCWLPAAPGWSWLLISDGVYKVMRLDELAEAMAAPTPAETCATVRRKVHERGPDDNYTAVMVRALGGPAPAAAPPPASGSAAMPSTSEGAMKRSAVGGIALAMAALALALAGFAVWSGRDTALGSEDRARIERLRVEVDSLRALLSGAVEPLGPTGPDPSTLPPRQTPPQ